MSKITNGLNDRPKDGSIAQKRRGVPDDRGGSVKPSDKEVESARRKLQDGDSPAESTKRERDKDRSPTPGTT